MATEKLLELFTFIISKDLVFVRVLWGGFASFGFCYISYVH